MNSELKTAEEVFNDYVNIRTVGNEIAQNIIDAMVCYAAQFKDRTPSPSGGIKTETPFYEILNEKLKPLGKSVHSFDLATWNAILNSADEFYNQFAGDGLVKIEDVIKLLQEDARHYKQYGDHVECRTVNECISKIERYFALPQAPQNQKP